MGKGKYVALRISALHKENFFLSGLFVHDTLLAISRWSFIFPVLAAFKGHRAWKLQFYLLDHWA